MNWDTKQVLTSGMMYDLFPTLSEEQQKVVDYLREKGKSQINIMTRELNFSYSTLSSLLFEMEMQDWVLSYPGGIYDLR
jgi:DNA processing protein